MLRAAAWFIKPPINLIFSPTVNLPLRKPLWSVLISFGSTYWSPFVMALAAILYESEFNRVIGHQVRLC